MVWCCEHVTLTLLEKSGVVLFQNKVVRWSLDETSRTMNSDTTTTLRQMASSEQDMAKDSPQKAVKWSDKDCNTTSDTCSETPESLQETARQLAKQLVASVLTNSVAQCIKVECENTRNTYHHSISTMQVSVRTTQVSVSTMQVSVNNMQVSVSTT